jgi:hypothetical protein
MLFLSIEYILHSLFMIQFNSVFTVMIDMLSVQGNIDKKWEKKLRKHFGEVDSRRERG